MADEALIFDATGSNVDGTDPGSPLAIGPGTDYNLLEHSYPAPPINVLYASTIDSEGELPVTSRYGNRTITLKLDIVDADGSLLAALQVKYTKLQREGGTLKRTLKNGDVRIYDVVASDGWDPVYDLKYYLGDLVEVSMTLPARPFSRGVEVALSDHAETSLPVLIFTEASIPGDVHALGRLLIDEDQSERQETVFWGIQSRYYDSASTAALFFQGESLSLDGSGAVATGPSGASGGASNNTMANLSLATSLASFAVLDNGTHTGTFRLFARVQVAGAGDKSMAAQWTLRGNSEIQNGTVTIPGGMNGSWLIADLGLIAAGAPLKGSQHLTIKVTAASTNAGDDIYLDWITLLPVEEGSGEAGTPTTSSTFPLINNGHLEVRHDGVLSGDAVGTYWGRPPIYEGDYLLIPPSGAEGRTVRAIVKASRGRLVAPSVYGSDSGIDDISALLYITPRYLT